MNLPSLTNVLNFFESQFSSGRSSLLSDVQNILQILVILEVIFAGFYLALGTSADIKAIARKILVVGFFYWVILNYGDILRFVVDGFLYAGEKAGSGSSIDFATLRDPGRFFVRGMELAKPLTNKLFSDINSSYFGIPSVDGLMLLFCIILTVFSFAIIAIQIFITYLEYLLVATAGFIVIPFGVFKPTAFLAERVFGAIIAFGIKLMVLALIIGVSDKFLQTVSVPATVSWQEAIELSVISLAISFLSLHAPGVAQSLLSGTPHLSFGSIAATTAGSTFAMSRIAPQLGTGTSAIASGTLKAAGAIHGGGVVAAASLGKISDERGVANKLTKTASKASLYAVGGAGGLLSAGISESSGVIANGKNSSDGSRAYRERIGDTSLTQPHAQGFLNTGGIAGNFNSGRYAVSSYRKADEERRKDTAGKEMKAKTEDARQEQKNSDLQNTDTSKEKA